ncbi:LacI family DNA-binding transcriptional regulator [Aliiglaciecola sp. CAU 1673]|uniref:LacI family DNA-binding transcriptional regulator n=1 Tax=Aliiglaciecola sp. CAU 1673 TaxID=3032595 RepID=UPI0023DA0B04|nr:LacI family DNA-binding transcriptional regulator [Aliiglaciecola sp. CAU 1673]MDF2179865.1 LacI family DNA-binding transcriptional regulator [Aliiglaciecola sp. CAU 1673]
MKSTIKEVAQLAGVSIKTVSRVINKEAGVRDDTVQRVQAAIKELSYEPNLAARNLAGTRSYTLGYVYDNPNAYYVIDMQNGILGECREQGYELIIHPCNASSPTICDELKTMVQKSQLAGLVISPPLSEMPQVLATLQEMDVQFVRIISGSDESQEHTPCVFVHDKEAGKEITNHLIALGHSNIAFIGGDKDHRSTGERFEGYKKALQEHGVPIKQEYLFEGTYSFETGVKGARALLEQDAPPTAIFACNDEIAAGALFAARLMGVDVPKQLSIAGFEDSPFSRQTLPKLTTAAQPTNVIAKQATALLISQIKSQRGHPQRGHQHKTEVSHRHFEPQLVVRESTQRQGLS